MRHYENQPSGTVGRARALRRTATDAEKALRRALRTSFPQHKFHFQCPIGPYYADFLCFAERLVIEVDGGQYDEASDAGQTRFIEREGYQVLRFWNNDVLGKIEGVLTQISLSLREREGAAQRRKGEGDVHKTAHAPVNPLPSPSHRTASSGALPLPKGKG